MRRFVVPFVTAVAAGTVVAGLWLELIGPLQFLAGAVVTVVTGMVYERAKP